MTERREDIAAAIRTFCQSLGAASVQMSHGVERIYYAGLSLEALAVAVDLALTHRCSAGTNAAQADTLERLSAKDAEIETLQDMLTAAEARLAEAVKLIKSLTESPDPHELIAENGMAVVDGWCNDARRFVAEWEEQHG